MDYADVAIGIIIGTIFGMIMMIWLLSDCLISLG